MSREHSPMKPLHSEAAVPIRSLLAAAADSLAAARPEPVESACPEPGQAAGTDRPDFEARAILAHVLDTSPGSIAAADCEISPTDARIMNHLVALRTRHMPLNYVLRNAEFMGLRFRTDARALSPRQETELLAEIFIEHMQRAGAVSELLVDVGCGCGVLGLSVAYTFCDLTLISSDISGAALQLYRENARLLGLTERSYAVAGSYLRWLSPEGARSVRYLVSNPPYVRPADYEALQPEIVRYEPRVALVSPSSDGLGAYREIAAGLPDMVNLHLAGFEIGYDQAQVADIMRQARPDMKWNVHNDYAGHPRIVIGEANG